MWLQCCLRNQQYAERVAEQWETLGNSFLKTAQKSPCIYTRAFLHAPAVNRLDRLFRDNAWQT
jgi:hypothetical protein